jgi:uncharacterized protein (TIGR04255 family)
MQFDQPPLIELVAELKWLPDTGQTAISPSSTTSVPSLATSSQEEFFSAFFNESARSGWAASERVIPINFPQVTFLPALRIRSTSRDQAPMLYQLGTGIFAANALPPYKNWDSFRPFAERGLEYLLKTRPPSERDRPFFSVIVRYLDLFTPELIGDVSPARFLTETLGFTLTLPPALGKQINVGSEPEPQIALTFPLAPDLTMRLAIGPGNLGDKKGIVMNTEVSSQGNVEPNRDAVIAVWERAHTSIRNTFMGLTEKLHLAMKPTRV